MNIKTETALLALARGRTLALDDASGTVVRVLRGNVWVTQYRDAADHVLAPGDSFRLDRPGLAVIQAMSPARVCLEGA